MNTALLIFLVLFITGTVLADESNKKSGTDVPTGTCQEEYAYIEGLETTVWEETGVRPTETTKPQCLEDGTYAPRQCMYGHCRCVAADGTILTMTDFKEEQAALTDCSCARAQHEYSNYNMIGKIFRCTDIGSYEPIQCSGSVCFCADVKGVKLGKESVNIGLISTLKC